MNLYYFIILDDGTCQIDLKPEFIKKYPLDDCTDIRVGQKVFNLPK